MTDITELALITKIKNQLKNFDTVVLREDEANALVEALEKAQNAKRTLESLGYTDNGGELWKPPVGPKPNFSLMDSYRRRVAELEFIRTSADKVQREFAAELGCAGDNESILQAIEDLKQQAESRTVTVKLPRPGFITISGECMAVYMKGEVVAALLAAGIKWEAE